MSAIEEVIAERLRQVRDEGWTAEHDDQHGGGELAAAAACYARDDGGNPDREPPSGWPWGWPWWKPKDRRRNLVRAGALILAELERLDRCDALAALERAAGHCEGCGDYVPPDPGGHCRTGRDGDDNPIPVQCGPVSVDAALVERLKEEIARQRQPAPPPGRAGEGR